MKSPCAITIGVLPTPLATALPQPSVHGVLATMKHVPANTSVPLHLMWPPLLPQHRYHPHLFQTPVIGSALNVMSQESMCGMGATNSPGLPYLTVLHRHHRLPHLPQLNLLQLPLVTLLPPLTVVDCPYSTISVATASPAGTRMEQHTLVGVPLTTLLKLALGRHASAVIPFLLFSQIMSPSVYSTPKHPNLCSFTIPPTSPSPLSTILHIFCIFLPSFPPLTSSPVIVYKLFGKSNSQFL